MKTTKLENGHIIIHFRFGYGLYKVRVNNDLEGIFLADSMEKILTFYKALNVS